MKRHRSTIRQTRLMQGTLDPDNNRAADAAADAARALALRLDKAVIVVVVPTPEGVTVGEVMAVKHWGHDGDPHCTCGEDTHDHICGHIQVIGHVLRLHADIPFDDPE